MPIASNAADAVTQSRAQNIPLVVAVLSAAGASSERELLDACNFTDVVFLCAEFGSPDAVNFGQMFPLPVTPIVYFILPSGKPVAVLKSSFSCSDVHDGIAKALSAMERSPSPPPPMTAASQGASAAPAGETTAADGASLAQRKVRARGVDATVCMRVQMCLCGCMASSRVCCLLVLHQAALLAKLAEAKAREEEAKKIADRDAELKRREDGRKTQALAVDLKNRQELAAIQAVREQLPYL